MPELNNNSAFAQTDDMYGKKAQPTPVPEKQVGIDTDNAFFDSIIDSAISNTLDMAALNSFNQASRGRDQIYSLIDSMCEDSTMAAVLETYAEDATETNDSGRIVWADSSDPDISKYITYLLDAMRVDKNIYSWTHSLCKYGDLYLRIYRESDYEDGLFDEAGKDSQGQEANIRHRLNEEVHLSDPDLDPNLNQEAQPLNEDVNIKAYKADDHFVHYLEMQPNPALMFELTRFGKTYAYIQTNVMPTSISQKNWNGGDTSFYGSQAYSFKRDDIDVYAATEFVHGCLEDTSNRTPETVSISHSGDVGNKARAPLSYKVKRGQSLFYNDFKTWRELTLLQNSLLLNRLTRSSIVRAVGVEVGDMPKENIQPHLLGVKRLFEQSTALTAGQSMSEYTNPGPIENNVYIPTRNGQGAITIQTVGGDVNISQIADVEFFRDRLFGCLRGETLIQLVDGRQVTIKELHENIDQYVGAEVYCCHTDGQQVVTTIEDALLTKKEAQFIHIELEGGKSVDVTPEHLMMLADGSFVEAQYLTEDDELMAL